MQCLLQFMACCCQQLAKDCAQAVKLRESGGVLDDNTHCSKFAAHVVITYAHFSTNVTFLVPRLLYLNGRILFSSRLLAQWLPF